ncbi:Uncharacterized damage-inducible protein DinB (forms a four-helix bundle) [Reichenbachiella faecimaris]|uniref:Uncharacterized damage-inducible protein DinB (Forms a four-helix bundle) n=1 Tax=Reichenbachiella faecimaris TaxID=692418 RepID=A0A1W2GI07_REIFA|nr:DinB family protein [Reichenbachiella faecimaris]SMD36299.1 Uncharacterized damage-inducible protein DinB (forms a four-helix bundle) [Reichenbachiella faecimaris]
MKIKKLVILLFLIPELANAQSKFGTEMAIILSNMKTYTLEVVELMPPEKYMFKPYDSARTFMEEVDHMSKILEFQTKYILGGQGEFKEQRELIILAPVPKTKSEALSAFETRFDESIALMNSLDESEFDEEFTFFFFRGQPVKTKRTIAMGLRDHVTHHRSKLVLYLRMNGIEPPFYQIF